MFGYFNSLFYKLYELVIQIDWYIIFSIFYKVIICYFAIWYLFYIFSLIFMLRKEESKWWIALIPIYNIYYFMKYIKIKKPFLIFIPLVNIVYLYVFNYMISRAYKNIGYTNILAMIFPFIYLPIFAFNKKKTRYYEEYKNSIKNQFDIYNLEEELDSKDNNFVVDDSVVINPEEFGLEITPNAVDLIEAKLENSSNNLDIPIEDVFAETTTDNGEILSYDKEELDDLDKDDEITDEGVLFDIKKIDEISKNAVDINKVVGELDAKDVIKDTQKDAYTIAFGGITQQEKSTTSKDNNMICKRCGSSLVGSNGFCPGCGAKIN